MQWRSLGIFAYLPESSCLPVRLDQTLHWMVDYDYKNETDIPPCKNSIMLFNMETEEFSTLPHPGKATKVYQDLGAHEDASVRHGWAAVVLVCVH